MGGKFIFGIIAIFLLMSSPVFAATTAEQRYGKASPAQWYDVEIQPADPAPIAPNTPSITIQATATCNGDDNSHTASVRGQAPTVGAFSPTPALDCVTHQSAPISLTFTPPPSVGVYDYEIYVSDLNPPSDYTTQSTTVGEFTVTVQEPAVCGNGVQEGSEQCDGSDFNGDSCSSLGFDGGPLSCSGSCTFVTSACWFDACTDDADCNDGNSCTVNTCQTSSNPNVCSSSPAPPACGGLECGTDACGNACPDTCGVGENCVNNLCVPSGCTDTRTDAQVCGPQECGVAFDNCGAPRSCGPFGGGCPGGETCSGGVCIPSEDCDNGVDDNGNGFIDEHDSSCGLNLQLTPSASGQGDSITASWTANDGSLYTSSAYAYKLCDYRGCDTTGGDTGTCTGLEFCAPGSSTATNCNFNAPTADGDFLYYVCAGNNPGDSATLTVGEITGSITGNDCLLPSSDYDNDGFCNASYSFSTDSIDANQDKITVLVDDSMIPFGSAFQASGTGTTDDILRPRLYSNVSLWEGCTCGSPFCCDSMIDSVLLTAECDAGHYWNGSACAVGSPPACTESIPANASSWGISEEKGLTTDTPWTYADPNTLAKCEFHCDPGYVWNPPVGKVPGACIPFDGCGDGTNDSGEQCDDGNTIAADGCSAVCLVEFACSSSPGFTLYYDYNDDGAVTSADSTLLVGYTQATCPAGKVCDVDNDGDVDGNDENALSTLVSVNACSLCGDTYVDGSESCDDGNTIPGDGCDASCQIEATYDLTVNVSDELGSPVYGQVQFGLDEVYTPQPGPLYTFTLSPGTYDVSARQGTAFAEENGVVLGTSDVVVNLTLVDPSCTPACGAINDYGEEVCNYACLNTPVCGLHSDATYDYWAGQMGSYADGDALVTALMSRCSGVPVGDRRGVPGEPGFDFICCGDIAQNPPLIQKVSQPATISADARNLVVFERRLNYEGSLVKMNIVTIKTS